MRPNAQLRGDNGRELASSTLLGAMLRSPAGAFLVGTTFLTLHLGLSHPDFGTSARLGAAIMGFLAFLALRDARLTRLPFLPYFATYFYAVYGAATFSAQRLLTARGPVHISDEARTNAVWACTLVVAIALAAARIGRPMGAPVGLLLFRVMPTMGLPSLRGAIRIWAVVTMLVQASLSFAVGVGRYSDTVYVLSLVAAPALAQSMLHVEWASSRASESRLWFWGATLGFAALGFASGALNSAAVPLLAALILSWSGTGRFNAKLFGLIAAIAIIFNPAKFEYRRLVWSAPEDFGVLERVETWGKAIEKTWGAERSDVEANLNTTRGRFSESVFVAQVFDWVPRNLPFAGFGRWKMVVYSYIPRAIWKEKPLLTRYYNADYAMAFGLQDEESTETTAINLPLVTDAYWTAGWSGVAVAAILVGLLLGFYEAAFDPRRWEGVVLGMPFLLGVPALSHVSAFFIGIPQRLVVTVAVVWLVGFLGWLLSGNRRG